ncbi:MAG: tetratricopeptide repeat protein [Bacteroidales bacterium]
MSFKIRGILLGYILFCITSSWGITKINIDTLEIHVEGKKTQDNLEEYKKIIKSGDKRKIAELLNNTGIYFANKGEVLRSVVYFEQAIQYFLEIQSKLEAALAYGYLALVYYDIARYEKAIECFNEAETLFIEINDKKNLGKTYSDIAFIYFNTIRLTEAIEFFKKSHEIYKSIGDTIGTIQTMYFVGNVFNEKPQLDSALHYYIKTLEFEKKYNLQEEIASSYNNIGVIYYEKADYQKAIEYLKNALVLIEQQKNAKSYSVNLNNVGNIYFIQNDYNTALDYYMRSLFKKDSIKYLEGKSITYFNIGNVYRNIKQPDKALEYYNKGIDIALTFEQATILAKCYKSVSEIYKEKGELDKAFEYYHLYVQSAFSILTDEASIPLSEMEDKYLSDRIALSSLEQEYQLRKLFTNYDTELKNKQIKILSEKRKTQRRMNFAYIGVFLFVCLTFILLYTRHRIKKRYNKNLAEKNIEIEKQTAIIALQSEKLMEANKELEKLSIVASDTDNAVIIMDAQGNFEWVNESFTRLFGLTYNELVSTVSKNMIGERTPDYIKEKFNYCIQTGNSVSYELQTTNAQKEKIWVNVTLTPILGEDGKVSKLVSLDTDITAIKKAEAEILQQKEEIEAQRDELQNQRDYILEQNIEIQKQKNKLEEMLHELRITQKKLIESEKMASLGTLVAGFAHEINTPIGVGVAAASSLNSKSIQLEEMFTTKTMKMSDLEQYLETTKTTCDLILSNLNRAADLVKSFKQISVDNITEQKRKFFLNEYLHDIVKSLTPKYKNRPIEFQIHCEESIALVSYPGAYAQIFTNFIVNSLLHGFEQNDAGVITISAAFENNKLVMKYSDTGKGIPKDHQDKIFDPFFTTNMQHGTGLGMNITYNLVTNKLGGEIHLESSEGQGVIFTITIPADTVK